MISFEALNHEGLWISGEGSSSLGVLAKINLDTAEQSQVLEIAVSAFSVLNEKALLKQGANVDELKAEIEDETVLKLLLADREDKSRIVGYLAVHTDPEHISWLGSEAKKYFFGQSASNGNFYYNSSLEITKASRSLANVMLLLGAGARYLYQITQIQRGLSPIIGFDYCRENDPGIPLLMSKSLKRQGLPLKVSNIARHNWFVFGGELDCSEELDVDVRSSSERMDGACMQQDLGETTVVYDPTNKHQIKIAELELGDIVLERIGLNNPSIFSTDSYDFGDGFWHLGGVSSQLQVADVATIRAIARRVAENINASDHIYVDVSSRNFGCVQSIWQYLGGRVWPRNGGMALRDYQMYSVVHGGE